jgi:hypothetical protein
MRDIIACLRARVFGNPRSSAVGLALAAAGAGLIFGAEAVQRWASDLTAGGALAAVVLPLLLMRDPGKGDGA